MLFKLIYDTSAGNRFKLSGTLMNHGLVICKAAMKYGKDGNFDSNLPPG